MDRCSALRLGIAVHGRLAGRFVFRDAIFALSDRRRRVGRPLGIPLPCGLGSQSSDMVGLRSQLREISAGALDSAAVVSLALWPPSEACRESLRRRLNARGAVLLRWHAASVRMPRQCAKRKSGDRADDQQQPRLGDRLACRCERSAIPARPYADRWPRYARHRCARPAAKLIAGDGAASRGLRRCEPCSCSRCRRIVRSLAARRGRRRTAVSAAAAADCG